MQERKVRGSWRGKRLYITRDDNRRRFDTVNIKTSNFIGWSKWLYCIKLILWMTLWSISKQILFSMGKFSLTLVRAGKPTWKLMMDINFKIVFLEITFSINLCTISLVRLLRIFSYSEFHSNKSFFSSPNTNEVRFKKGSETNDLQINGQQSLQYVK